MNDELGVIYKATNNITDKIYIGQSNNFAKRIKSHVNASFNDNSNSFSTPFHKAIREYGYENFNWEVEYTTHRNELNLLEAYFIKHYNSFENGYNSTPGGDAIKIKNHRHYDDKKFKFFNTKTNDTVRCTRNTFIKIFNLDGSNVSKLIQGKLNSLSNWVLQKHITINIPIDPPYFNLL